MHPLSHTHYTVLHLVVAQGSHGDGHELFKMQQSKVQSTFKVSKDSKFWTTTGSRKKCSARPDPGCDANVFTILCPGLAAGKSPFCG